MQKALFLDLDQTVVYSKRGDFSPLDVSDVKFYEGVKQVLKRYKRDGYLIFGVSNKGGIAFGIQTHRSVNLIHSYINEKLDYLFDKIFYSGRHPNATLLKYKEDPLNTRKPGTGMAILAQQWTIDKYQEGIDFKNSIMVGDKDTDRQFSRNSGIGHFYWASNFFKAKRSASKRVTLYGVNSFYLDQLFNDVV